MVAEMKELTEKQINFINTIRTLENKNRQSPTIKELACELGIRVSAVSGYIERLSILGILSREYNLKRGIKINYEKINI